MLQTALWIIYLPQIIQNNQGNLEMRKHLELGFIIATCIREKRGYSEL